MVDVNSNTHSLSASGGFLGVSASDFLTSLIRRKWLLVQILGGCMLLGVLMLSYLTPTYSSYSVIKLQSKTGGALSGLDIQNEKSAIQSDVLASSVIKSEGGLTGYLKLYGEYKSDAGLTGEELTLQALEIYASNLEVFNFPNTAIFRIEVKGRSPSALIDIVNSHVKFYLEIDEKNELDEFLRAEAAIGADIERSLGELELSRANLLKFAKTNDVFDLDLDDSRLVELRDGTTIEARKEDSSQLLSPEVQVQFDFLQRNYKFVRSGYFNKVTAKERLLDQASVSKPVAVLISPAAIAENVTLSALFVLLGAVLFGCLLFVFSVFVLAFFEKARFSE